MALLDYTVNKNAFGVRIHDINLAAPMTADTILKIQHLFQQYKLIIFEHQTLNDEQLCSFAHRFGPPFHSTRDNPVLGGEEQLPSIIIVGNQADEYEKTYLGHMEVLPHSDHQWLRCPSSASLLYAVDIAQDSASTTWTDMVAAYSLLDDSTKARINTLKLVTYNPFHRPFGSILARYVNSQIEVVPGEVYPHPLVRTHPVTGEKILYLHAAYEMELLGVAYNEGAELIDTLHKHMSNIECKYEHSWKNGDVVMWDNQATVHYRPEFDKAVRRVLKRVSIAGGIPF